MRSRLPRAAALLILSVGSSLLVWPGTGSADDVDHNAVIRERIAKWKATPQAAILVKGVQFEAVSPITPPGERKAIALCIGVNKLDQAHYIGTEELGGCVNDAKEMQRILSKAGFTVTLMTDGGAKTTDVLPFIDKLVPVLHAGDTLVVTYSGHGGQVPDDNGDEDDGLDETWCLHDRQVRDDTLADLWRRFEAGVHIVLISDSCHSGTVANMVVGLDVLDRTPPVGVPLAERPKLRTEARELKAHITRLAAPQPGSNLKARFIPKAKADAIYLKNKALYDADRLAGIQSDKRSIPEVKATVVLLGACQDKEVSWERGGHGLFTSAMIAEWDGGFRGSYRELFDRVSERVKPSQHPNLFAFGPATDELKKAPAFQK